MLLHGNHTRVDTLELKVSIVKKIGPQRAEKYLDHLRKLFSLKISKHDFDRCCVRVIGKENIPLHNALIRSIISNACAGKIPPVKTTAAKAGNNLKVGVGSGKQRNCLQSLCGGDVIPPSPRKGRSPVKRDRRFRDRPSPLGPLGKTPSNVISDDSVNKAQEQQTAAELLSLGSRPPVEVASVEEGEEVEQEAASPCVQSRTPVTAPFGVTVNSGKVYRSLSRPSMGRSQHWGTCRDRGELPDTPSLRSRLQQQLQMEGINVTVDCVNLLNNGLDVYMKRLMEPCLQLAASRSGFLQRKQGNNQLYSNVHRAFPEKQWQKPTRSYYASPLDFRSAVEMKPLVLGEDWPMQLEKICLSTSEEWE